MGRLYTIGDAAVALGMPASTIRFYDKNGLIPHMSRSENGIRVFNEDDLEWMRFIERLKVSGMPIREIREYIDLTLRGDSTIEERRRIVYERKAAIEEQLRELELAHEFLVYKCWFYDVASESGTTETPQNMPEDQIPEEIRRIKEKCQVNKY